MTDVSLTELAKIPYLDVSNLRGRTISSLSFFADGEWQLWIPTDQGLTRMKGWPGEGFYFAREPELPTDVYLHFLDFIAQRSCWPSVQKPLHGLMEDFFNLGACVKKFDVILSCSSEPNVSKSRLVITELEYLFNLCRSIFDLLQEVITAQWHTVRLFDRTIEKRQLPKRFSSVALAGEHPRTESEIVKRFSIPFELAGFYTRSAPFFSILRTFRDQIVHRGTTFQLIFATERGFAVQSTTKPFCDFHVWDDEHMLPNQLCSLRPIIAHLVNQSLLACEDYATTMQSIIEYPPPIVPGFRFYMRSYFGDSLHGNKKVLEECLWWDE